MLMSSEFLAFCSDKTHASLTRLVKICPVPLFGAALSNGHPAFKLYVRRCILHAFQNDDWACAAALISTTSFAALSLAVIEYGAGRHLANIAVDDARIFYYVRSDMAHGLPLDLRHANMPNSHAFAPV